MQEAIDEGSVEVEMIVDSTEDAVVVRSEFTVEVWWHVAQFLQFEEKGRGELDYVCKQSMEGAQRDRQKRRASLLTVWFYVVQFLEIQKKGRGDLDVVSKRGVAVQGVAMWR